MVKARVVRRMRSPGALANPQTVLAMFGTPLVATGALVRHTSGAQRNPFCRCWSDSTSFGSAVSCLSSWLLQEGSRGPFPHISGRGDFVTARWQFQLPGWPYAKTPMG
jgi:hypothetical protein